MQFHDIVALEPRVGELMEKAEQLRKDVESGKYYTWCELEFWYGSEKYPSLKNELSQLVGWHSTIPALQSEVAYDVAYDTIYETLPSCPTDCNRSKNEDADFCQCLAVSDLFKAYRKSNR